MSLLQKLGTGQGYLKAGFLGFQKSGKTYTATLLAIGTREHFGLDGPIAMFDTEGGAEYIAKMVRERTGKDLIGMRSRSFDDLCNMAEECVAEGVSVLVADSMTHVWRELCDAYMKQVNDQIRRTNERFSKKRPLRQRLEFQDWAHVKGIWSRWTDFYTNSALHIVICGRAGFEYDMQESQETGRKELVKTGIKMKTEGEFGFEPSLLVEMDREQEPDGDGGFVLRRRATVLGDRFGVIDGATTIDPTFEFFAPHVRELTAGAHAAVDTRIKTDVGIEDNEDEWTPEKKLRVILCEEIQGELVAAYPGQKADDKKAKADLIHQAFGTRSWTRVESMDSERLRQGLTDIRSALGRYAGSGDPVADENADQDGLSFPDDEPAEAAV
jgi:hypothetical protein